MAMRLTTIRRDSTLTRAISILVLVALILPTILPARAQAQGGSLRTPPNLLNDYLLSKATDDYPLPGTTGLFKATPAQYGALLRLQEEAIANTLTDFSLGPDDASAVQSWGREEAIVRLWSLFMQAASAVRWQVATSDQQLVNAWLQSVLLRFQLRKMVAAGLEYVKYAGLDHDRYRQVVNGFIANAANGGWQQPKCIPPDHSTLTCDDFKALYDFMQTGFTSPKNYWAWTDQTSNATKMATATEGYCAYRSPSAPAGVDDFPVYPGSADNSAFCLTPAPLPGCLFDCNPAPPHYEEFKAWGAMLATENLMSGTAAGTTVDDFLETWNQIAIVTAVAGACFVAIGGVTAVGLSGLAGFFAANLPSVAQVIIGPSLRKVSYTPAMFSRVHQVARAGVGRIAGGAAGAAITAGVTLFILGTAIESYQIAEAISVPQQLAEVIQEAARDYKDMAGVFQDPSEEVYGELFSLFVAATAPSPRTNCSNTNSAADVQTCLNPPEPPAPSPVDAPFRVWSQNQTADQAVLENTITWYDETSTVTHTARLHGAWFIVTSTDSSGNVEEFTYKTALKGLERQSLRIFYTDWNQVQREASLFPSTGGMTFMSLGLRRGDSTNETYAWTQSETLQYVDAAGNKKQASVALDIVEPPAVAPSWNPAPPVEGSPVTFTANGSSAAGTPFYEWKYQVSDVYVPFLNGWFVCGSPPCYGPTFYGDNPAITFPRSGDFHMLLTATNSVGRATAYPFTLSVGDVPPTNTLAPACNVTPNGSPCPVPFNPTIWIPGQTTNLTGTLRHIGPLDTVKVTIDWGDGTTSTTNGCGPAAACGVPGSVTFTSGFHVPDMPWSATHTYAVPGVYKVFATASEHPGGADTATITESVLYQTALGLSPSSPTSVYGQPVTLTATVSTVGTVPSGTAPAGTVTFLDGTTTLGTGQLSVSGVATFTTSALGIGTHAFKATYNGDQAFRPATAPALLPGGFIIPITVTVNKAATSSAIASSVSPSVFGQPVTFTATVSPMSPGAGNPSGSVDFKDGNATICAAKPVNGIGQATCTTSALAAAGHSVTASYLGDANFIGSTSPAGSQTVNRATTITAVGSSKPTSTGGDTVTLTATVTVTAPGAGMPGGTVTFKDGATTLGTAALGAGATASFSTSSLASAAHSITADYGGDSSFVASTGQFTQFVNTSLSGYPMLPTGAVNLGGVNLGGGYFFDALLAGADLSNSNFKNATFIRAILAGADMSGSNFRDAKFSNANLSGANLTGANLLGATGLMTATLTNVIWSKTTCPDGFVTAKTGGSCVGHLR